MLYGREVERAHVAALLAAAVFMLMRQLSLFPAGSEEIGVRGLKLALVDAESGTLVDSPQLAVAPGDGADALMRWRLERGGWRTQEDSNL